MSVRVQREDFDLGAEVAALRADNPPNQAIARGDTVQFIPFDGLLA